MGGWLGGWVDELVGVVGVVVVPLFSVVVFFVLLFVLPLFLGG